MQDEPVSSDIEDQDIVPDEHEIKYDIEEISNVLSELSNIQNAMNKLQKQFDLINNAILNSRKTLHQLQKNEDLPW